MLRVVRICLCCFLICCACQKVELPTETSGGGTGGDAGETETVIPEGMKEYSVNEVLTLYGQIKSHEEYTACVHGYIVGFCSGTTIGSAKFTAEGARASNLLIAAWKGETEVECCLPVELKNGSVVRGALNLQDHPEYLGKRLLLYGKITPYFSVVGLKTIQSFRWLQEELDVEPEHPEPDDPNEEPSVPTEPDAPGEVTPDIPDNPVTPETPEESGDTLKLDDVPQIVPGGRIFHH